MTFDVDRARRETPGVDRVLHLNNAGAALPPASVLAAQIDYLRLEAGIGGYEAADRERGRIEHVYDAVARLIGCASDEVAIVENATRAWDMAFYALAAGFRPGDRILTAEAEYGSNYIAFLQAARRTGAVVEAIPSGADGRLSVEALRAMLDERVKLIAVTHVPTNGGLVNPAAEIGAVARAHGIPYLLDACQSVGQMPVDVGAIGCDMLSATSRKFLRGPRGTGFLYVRRSLAETLEPPFLDVHAATWTARDRYAVRPDARRFENWECNLAAKIGLGVAVDYALDWGLEAIGTRVRALADGLRARLATVPGTVVRDLGPDPCGIVTFTVDGADHAALKAALTARGINVSVSRRPSTRLDMEARGLDDVVRASVHYYNIDAELDRFVAAVTELRGER